jgi:hypothetical protein
VSRWGAGAVRCFGIWDLDLDLSVVKLFLMYDDGLRARGGPVLHSIQWANACVFELTELM